MTSGARPDPSRPDAFGAPPPDWRLDWEQPDSAIGENFHENKKAGGRFHPVKAVLPFFWAIVASVGALLAFAYGELVGAFLFVVVVTMFLRRNRFLKKISPIQMAIVVGAALWFIGFDTSVALVMIGSLAIAFFQLAEYFMTTFNLTDRRIYMVSGFVTRRIDTLPLRALTDMRYEQTPVGKFLNYGHFFVESAGQDQALSKLLYVPQPRLFYASVLKEALGDSSPPPPPPPGGPQVDLPAQAEPEPDVSISLEEIISELPRLPDDPGDAAPPR